MATPNAQRQKAYRDRKTAQGLRKVDLYALPEHHAQIKAFAAKLARRSSSSNASQQSGGTSRP